MFVLRLIAVHMRLAVLNEAQYRANFFTSLFQSVVAAGTGIVVITLVSRGVDSLNGWTKSDLLVMLGVFTVVGGAIRTFVKPNVHQFIEDVREGNLDFVFVKPVDSQLLVSIRTMQLWQAVDILTGAAIIVIGLTGASRSPSIVDIGLFLAMLVLSLMLVYSLLMLLGTTAFWFVRTYQILELFDGVWQAGRWPTGVYTRWLGVVLTAVVPIGVAITVPAEALTARVSGAGVAALTAITTVTFVLARTFWRFGLRRYTGASA